MASFGNTGQPIAALNDLVRVKIVCFLANQMGLTIRYWRVTTPSTGTTQGEVATAMDARFAPLYKAMMAARAEYLGVEVVNLAAIVPAAPAFNADGEGNGTVADDALPGQITGLVKLTSARAGRAFRGRVYIPFPGEDDNSELAKPQGGYITRAEALGAGLSTTIAAGVVTLTPTLYSSVHGGDQDDKDITGFVVREVWSTQRRRGDWGSPNDRPF